MSALLRGLTRLRSAPALRGTGITQRANLKTRPAKGVVGPVETVIGLAIFSVTILAPSGWVLANLENYKQRSG